MFSTGSGRYFFYLNFLGRLGLTCLFLFILWAATESNRCECDPRRDVPFSHFAFLAHVRDTCPVAPLAFRNASRARYLPGCPLGVSQRGRAVLSKAITSWYVYMCVTEKYVANYVIAERTHRFREGVRHPLNVYYRTGIYSSSISLRIASAHSLQYQSPSMYSSALL